MDLDDISYCVIDIETTIKNTDESKKKCGLPCPHSEKNYSVLYGFQAKDSSTHILEPDTVERGGISQSILRNSKIWVGQNLGFDLHYLTKDPKLHEVMLETNFLIWDTMIVEYILSGQSWKYPSLDGLCEHYGLELKPDEIKKYWEAGIQTEDIPKEELEPYLEHDLTVTEEIFLAQLDRVRDCGLIDVVFDEMRARKATWMMEHNGMSFSISKSVEVAKELEEEIETLEKEIKRYASTKLPTGLELNVGSNAELSALLFGGTIKREGVEQLVDEAGEYLRYKTGDRKGQLKTRKMLINHKIEGFNSPTTWEASETSKSGVYATDDAILKRINTPLTRAIRKYRTATKDLNTYFTGYAGLVWDDGLVHPTFNHCETPTGRLSCRNPNLQNITNTD